MDQAKAEALAEKGQAILTAAAGVDENMPVEAVFDLLRRRIGRRNKPTDLQCLLNEDAYWQRRRKVAREKDAAAKAQGVEGMAERQVMQSAAEVASRVQAVERMFYEMDPVPPARVLKILSQKTFIRDGLNGKLIQAGGGEPLTDVTAQHFLDWAAAGAAADAAAEGSA